MSSLNLGRVALVTSLVIVAAYRIFKSELPRRKAHTSLAGLPADARAVINTVYPEDFYPGGAYVTLPSGQVRYWLLGPEDGRKIVLVHGFSIPSIIWREVAPKLAEAGYRVLLFDLYGRGYTEAPDSQYTVDLYTTQLALLMQHIRWEKAIVAGLSMGGAITAAFIDQFPHLAEDHVVLIASVGLLELPLKHRLLSTRIFQTIAGTSLLRSFSKGRLRTTGNAEADISAMQRAYLPYYSTVLLLSLQYGPLRGQRDSFRSKSFVGKKVLILHGTRDADVPHKHAREIQSLLPEGTISEVIDIEGGTHDVTTSRPEVIVPAMLNFLGK